MTVSTRRASSAARSAKRRTRPPKGAAPRNATKTRARSEADTSPQSAAELMATPSVIQTERDLALAKTYAEWSAAARVLDLATGRERWKASDSSEHYDHNSIRNRLNRINRMLKTHDNEALLFELNEGIHGNMDGIGHEALYRTARFGSKHLVEDYVETIDRSLQYLASADVADIDLETKADFFHRAQSCFGRSALMLSGSGTYLYFHLGVVKALWEEGVLPSIISGSSGGSVIGALMCTHTDDEIGALFDPQRYVFDDVMPSERKWIGLIPIDVPTSEDIDEFIARFVPDLTFQEAFERTGRHLNVSVAPAAKHQNSRLLNAVTSPNVLIRTAVKASSAVPGVLPPVSLMARNVRGETVPYHANRQWVDGTVSDDLPAKRLARLYGVNHHIVSQANPVIAGLTSESKLQSNPFAVLQNATVKTAKAYLNAMATLLQTPLSYVPVLNSMSSVMTSLINQNFSGDINIVRSRSPLPLSKLLSPLNVDEIRGLIELGERTTWPKLEMIRIQTRIGRTLEHLTHLHPAD